MLALTPAVEPSLPVHPAAGLFPPMGAEAFEALKADIKLNGQISPIVVTGGLILDGCNRTRACAELGITPAVEEWDGQCGSPLAFVISKNLKRRHLSISQRAMIAARIANSESHSRADFMRKKDGIGIPIPSVVTNPEAAAMLNVSCDSVSTARAVLKCCSPEDIKAVDSGGLTLARAHSSIKSKQTTSFNQKSAVAAIGKNPQRLERMRLRNAVWKNIRTALVSLTSLPLPADAAKLAKEMDRRKLIPNKLPGALAWLKEFADVCDGKATGATNRRSDDATTTTTTPAG